MSEKRKQYTLPGVGFLTRTGKYAVDKKYANFNRRMFAATIDSMIAMIILAPIIDFLFRVYSPLPPIDWGAIGAQIPQNASEEEHNRIVLSYLLSSGHIGLWLNNFFLQCVALSVASGLCWYFWQATPGKMLMRLKVVDAKTEKPLLPTQIIMRLLGYVVSTLSLGIGFFWMGVDKRRQGWHDKLAGSVVIIAPRRKKEKTDTTPKTEAAAQSDSREPSKEE